MLLFLHSGFVLSVLNIIHVLDLESVCFDSKHLYYSITLDIFYILFIVFVDSWNVNRISISTARFISALSRMVYERAFSCIFLCIHTGCPRRNVPDFRRVFLMLNYTEITQNTYVQSRTVTEIMAREKCGRHGCRNTIRHPWRHTCPLPLPDQRDMVMQWPWRVRYSTVALTSQFNSSAMACVKYLEV